MRRVNLEVVYLDRRISSHVGRVDHLPWIHGQNNTWGGQVSRYLEISFYNLYAQPKFCNALTCDELCWLIDFFGIHINYLEQDYLSYALGTFLDHVTFWIRGSLRWKIMVLRWVFFLIFVNFSWRMFMMLCAHICNANCTTKFRHLVYMYTFYKCSKLTHHKW
jgi:hypothetical protein